MYYEAQVRAVQITAETDLLVEILKGQGIESRVGDWLVRVSEAGGGFCCLPDLAFKCLFHPTTEIQRVFVPVMTSATRVTPRVKPASPREGESDGDGLGSPYLGVTELALEALKDGPKSCWEVTQWVEKHGRKVSGTGQVSATLSYLKKTGRVVLIGKAKDCRWSLPSLPPSSSPVQSPTAEGTVPA